MADKTVVYRLANGHVKVVFWHGTVVTLSVTEASNLINVIKSAIEVK